MHVSTSIEDENGALIAVLAGRADLAEMSEIIELHTGLSASEDTYLVNAFNFFVTEPRFGEDYALNRAVRTEGVEDCLAGNDGVGFYDDYRDVPVAVIGAYHWIEERELCILTEIDQAEAYAPIDALRGTVVGLGAVVAVIVIVAGYVLARTITEPVRRLVSGAAEIGRGNLAHRIPVRGQDEIAEMAVALNVMAANLRQSLGETGYSERLLLALGQAAEDVQRAHSPDEVFSTVGDGLATLGYTGSILTLSDDGNHLT
ncbi:MAG: HAMP domain-containing protein, partial [Anaerolineales bacterium]